MATDELWNDRQVIAAVDEFLGDNGKGKVVDALSSEADITAKGGGLDNTGHISYLDDGTSIDAHFLTSAMKRDKEGKINLLGPGMGILQEGLINEMRRFEGRGITFNHFQISDRANLVLPHHVMLDQQAKSLKPGSIGTTGKGTGPLYEDRTARRGIVIGDLFNKDVFVRKVRDLDAFWRPILEARGFKIDISEVIERELAAFKVIKPFVRDTARTLEDAIQTGKRILLEGTQGLLLSYIYGASPYVTSCDTSRYGLAQGVGILPEQIDFTLGVVRAPVTNRVGSGPFPTEYGGKKSEAYCGEDDGKAHTKDKELAQWGSSSPDELIKDKDEFIQGIGWRMKMGNYGTSTGRPRRVGRLDLVALRYAVKINGPNIVLSSVDFANGMPEVEIGTGYRYAGKPYETASGTVNPGDQLNFTRDADLLGQCVGIYERLPGWKDEKDPKLENFCRFVELHTGGRVVAVSYGPRAEEFRLRG